MANPPPKIRRAIFLALALLALAVRLPQLGERPMHTDESINAYTTGELLAGQSFHYDPRDRHGPGLFLVAEPVARLAGARHFSDLTESELRLTPVLAGVFMVWLFGAGVEIFGFVPCLLAALLIAVAPLPVYYHRYFIHESLFVTATLGLILSGWSAWRRGSAGFGAVAGFCAAFMLACKETAGLHFLAMALAITACWLYRSVNRAGQALSWRQGKADIARARTMVFTALIVFLATSVFLFTWFGQNWQALADLFHAVSRFAARAGGEGHQKAWWYYLKLLAGGWSGGAMLALVALGILAVIRQLLGKPKMGPPGPRLFLMVYGLAMLVIYSAIPYKTPWLALNFWLPMALLAGMAVEWVWFAQFRFGTRTATVIFLIGLGGLLAHDTRQRVFIAPADENNPYAYAHTVDDLLGLPVRLAQLVKQEKLESPRIAVVAADAWPLPWYLRKYSRSQVGYWQPGQATGRADFYITSPKAANSMTNQLKGLNPEFFGVRPEVLIILWTPPVNQLVGGAGVPAK